MTDHDGRDGAPGRSLAGHGGAWLATWLRAVPAPRGYGPALAVLAAIPGVAAALAGGLGLATAERTAILRRTGADRIAAHEAARDAADRSAGLAPYLTAPTLTVLLDDLVAALPADATLHAVARDDRGVVRAEVDCPDPDALAAAFRVRPALAGWRTVAQSAAEGRGVRVTLASAAP